MIGIRRWHGDSVVAMTRLYKRRVDNTTCMIVKRKKRKEQPKIVVGIVKPLNRGKKYCLQIQSLAKDMCSKRWFSLRANGDIYQGRQWVFAWARGDELWARGSPSELQHQNHDGRLQNYNTKIMMVACRTTTPKSRC